MSLMVKQFMQEIKKETDVNLVHPLNKAMRDVAMIGYNSVTKLYRDGGRTPINTGFFRANWRLTLTKESGFSPDEIAIIDRPKTSIHAPDQFAGMYNQSRSAAERATSRFSVRSHTSIYLTNNVSYSELIEHGGEYIRPHGVLSHAVINMQVALDENLKAIK